MIVNQLPLIPGIPWDHWQGKAFLIMKYNNFKKVPTKLEPYIQMGGHGALISPENNVFIHFHPIGTISMASQQIFDKQQELASNAASGGICYYGLPAIRQR